MSFFDSSSVGLFVGLAAGLLLVPLLLVLARAFVVVVEDEHAVLVTRFGRHVATLKRPGLHVLPDAWAPWVRVLPVSLQRDFRHFRHVPTNDARGTTIIVDLWLELRVVDPAKALFEVADWDASLKNLVAHAATAILGDREFRAILGDRTELGARLSQDIRGETSRWGIEVDAVYIQNVALLPEVARQVETTAAARLERAQAEVEERGRLAVAELEADTAVRVARLVAEAKGQYPAAVGRALASLSSRPGVLAAYNALYDLSLVRPHRTFAFRGFGPKEMRAADAAMLAPPVGEIVAPGLQPLPGQPDDRLSRSRAPAPPAEAP